ncbi:hypothetical protein HNP82_002500 [Catenibacillus scindens]|uniref:Chorion class high-cysteine HCB protein 13 n=1 Tax=Catenibacillus scindens TaxID=673271 RepID=A0A7W8M696_9FIRM|nr:hypothetical protein [Catenibacillus scindens]MBB5265357.1 hypothetical protein [Catenibacillus scindens]
MSNCCWIILLLLLCGGNNGCGCSNSRSSRSGCGCQSSGYMPNCGCHTNNCDC